MLRLLRSPAPSSGSEITSGAEANPLAALARDAAAGSSHARRTLVVALGPGLLRVVRGVLGTSHPDTEDVLQDAMSAVCSALPSFRGECRTLHFACRIGVQTALNARRRAGYRNRHTPSVPPDELSNLARDECSPADALVASRRREALLGLLDELPTVQSEVLALHTMLGYSVEETAAVTEAPVNTVRSRLRAALSALRARVQADGALLEVMKGGL